MWVPPIAVRRIFIDPVIFVFALISVVVSPLLFIAAAIVDLAMQKHWKFLRSTRLFVVFMATEALGLIACVILWIVSGFGWKVRSPGFRVAHYRLLEWWLRVVSHEIQAAFGFTLSVPDLPPIEGPIIVFSRHAGPGDSVFLASTLLTRFDRFPRIVGKKELEFSPFFDVMGHRLPMRFIRPHPTNRLIAVEAVRDAATNLAEHDAFVLFPEGGNFTPTRREKVISSFTRKGDTVGAEYARSLANVLPPHPSGAFTAIDAAPTADVVFVAHTGTEDLISASVIWRGIPFGRELKATFWHVAAADVPTDHDLRVQWLNEQWRHVDAWIGEHRTTLIGEEAV